jgi:signal transduction histidine kinase
VLAVLLAGVGTVVYLAMGAALLDEIDTGLRFRAAAALSEPVVGTGTGPARRLDEEPGESVEQLVAVDGRVLRGSAGWPRPLLPPEALSALTGPRFFVRHLAGTPGETRLLATPTRSSGTPSVLLVGATMTDRSDALGALVDVLGAGGAIALVVSAAAGWVVGGWALRPVERMRRQAAAITASGLDRRLTPPPARDELSRLAGTLNDMLARLERAAGAERDFLARASHELRTPLAALRAELELALARPREPAELAAALDSAAEETERLVRLSDDLLVLARAGRGVPVRRERVALRDVVEPATALFRATAATADVELVGDAAQETVRVDPARMRQALVNLLANALRATPRGGRVTVTASTSGGALRVEVSDTGPGFPPGALARDDGAGLGLRIVRAIVAAHGGELRLGNRPVEEGGGASVVLTIPRAAGPEAIEPSRASIDR